MTSPIVHSSDPVALFGGGDADIEDVVAVQAMAKHFVAADGGAALAVSAGVTLDAVIGDFDSVSDDILAQIPKERHFPIAEQDSTDFDKALRHIEAPVVLAVGFLGGRIDHQLACLSVLARYPERPCILLGREECVVLCPPQVQLDMAVGAVVSLVPLGSVCGTSVGLRWPIDGLEFDLMSRVGTSNAAEGPVSLTMERPAMALIVPRACLSQLMQALVRAPRSARWPSRAGQYKDPPRS